MKTSSVADEWRAEGREEGRKLGREQGIELGRVETQRRTLKRLVSKRFGILPTELLAAIDSTDDASVLDDRFDDSLEAASFDDMKLRMRIRSDGIVPGGRPEKRRRWRAGMADDAGFL